MEIAAWARVAQPRGGHPITYKVNHHHGNPGPFIDVTDPLPVGAHPLIELTHSGAMNAFSCEAFYET